MRTRDEAIAYVIDRLEAWRDSARIANNQCPSSDMRNTMINYAHLIDVLRDVEGDHAQPATN
jgi:hypothetical protein